MIKTVGPKFRRAIHYDFHTSPGIENIFKNFDAEKFADQLSAAHVEYINMAARCNMGFSYYNTKVGKKYPGLGDRDPIKEIIEACHKRGIGVTAYFNVGIDHEMAADNYNWLKINKDGRIYSENKKGNFFRNMCYNSPYRQHFLSQVREVCEYDIDGLFCDCFRLDPCYCPKCMADMAKRGVDANNDAAVLEYQNNVRLEFAEEIKEATGNKRGKIKLYFNGLPIGEGIQTHSEIECLTTASCWGYDFFEHMAAYERTKYEDRVYMSARFQNEWGDFGGVKPLASMQNDLYDAMMNSYAISFGDHLHPVDGFENEVASRIGKVMEEKMLYEPYTENSDNIVEIGVLVNPGMQGALFFSFVKGIARMMKELKLTYNVYDEKGGFEETKLLIVGRDMDYTDELKARLCEYVKNGGKIIFAGTGIDVGKDASLLDYVELVGADTSDNAYYTAGDSDMRFAMYMPSRIIKNISGKEKARYVKNVFNHVWDGRQSTFYRPQGELTEYSAAVVNENTACICFDIFTAYIANFLVEHRDMVDSVIRELLPERLIEGTSLPKNTAVALTKTENCTVFHVKATYPAFKADRGIVEEHNYMKSAPVSLKGEYEVYVLPEMTKVDSRIESGRTSFETGDILGYKAFLLK